MWGAVGDPPVRVRPRGNIEALASGALRVRVYAGVDVLTGRELYLKQTVPAGRDAQRRAEQVRDQLRMSPWADVFRGQDRLHGSSPSVAHPAVGQYMIAV
jgi:hypothetical protein